MGQTVVARALWYVKPGVAELRSERLSPPQPGEVRVKTAFSALSRGTERLILMGEVPETERERMRAPLQAGEFPFPVKYGYSAAGTVTHGPAELVGKRVFSLHPHQDHFHAPAALVAEIPDTVPERRATLAANMETALNAHWDAGTGAADRVLVVGAGTVGLLTAYLARHVLRADVTITDIDPDRRHLAEALGLPFASPESAPKECRIVFHASATAAGLQCAIDRAAFEGRIVELSWYGRRPVTLDLGGAFHSRRLTILSSQVGRVAPAFRASVSPRERLARALALLDDPCLDALVADDIDFAAVPDRIAQLLTDGRGAPLPLIRYPD